MDDLSRYMWVAVIPSKDCVAAAIKEIQAQAEGKSGLKLRALRIDRGGEFTMREFAEYCMTVGVHHQCTVPTTHNRMALSSAGMARWWQPPGACSRPRVFSAGSGVKR
jgi:hypothetical protein